MSTPPIAGLNALMESVSAAARTAQQYLDSRSAEGPYAWYAIPQVAVQAKMSLTKKQGGIINIILGHAGTQEFTHQLGFSLVSTPASTNPAPAVAADSDAFSATLPDSWCSLPITPGLHR